MDRETWKTMGNGVPKVALWALVVVLLASSLAALPGARAGLSPNYTLTGYVHQPSGGLGQTGAPVPAGVSVELINGATHATYTIKTSSASGYFQFTSANTANALGPGVWGVTVLPQAGLDLRGCNPCAVLPLSPTPIYTNESVTNLTTLAGLLNVNNVSLAQSNVTLYGNVTQGGAKVPGANVQILDPAFPNFVLANNTTNSTGGYKFLVPHGTWVVETTVPGTPDSFNLSRLTIVSSPTLFNPVVRGYIAWGFMNQAAYSGVPVPNGGNVTLFDPATGAIYSSPTPPGGFYQIGTYPGGFVSGPETFDVILSAVGFGTSYFPITVSPGSQAAGSPHTTLLPSTAPPAQFATTLNFSSGFNNLSVATNAALGNDSVFPELANASVGQLWAQLALDWQHNLTFVNANMAAFTAWVKSEGQVFPAVQSTTTINGTGFWAQGTPAFASSGGCASSCDLNNPSTYGYTWAQKYNTTSNVASGGRTYTLSFYFRHPTHAQAYNYTVVLPTGYVLQANNPVPSSSRIVPAGPGGTYTSFTLVSNASTSQSDLATFTIVKYSTLTANVNLSVSNFAFSKLNVLNGTHASYEVAVGQGQNVTFSAANSTFSGGTNGTKYTWHYGDSGVQTTSKAVAYHTYAAAGLYHGTLTVTASSGLQNSTNITVAVGNTPPTIVLSSNATAAQTASAGGLTYYVVNWSTALSFNVTKSTSIVTGSTAANLSVVSWNLSALGGSPLRSNYSAGTGAKPLTPFNVTLLGAGHYYNSTTINGVPVTFHGWKYTLNVTVFDYGGHKATTSTYVLLKDTQKPVPVINLLNSKGHTIAASGIVEAANHTAQVQFSAVNSSDPHNGTIATYNWSIGDKQNTSANLTRTRTTPGAFSLWLQPQSSAYTVNLTVYDLAGNHAYVTASLTVSVNVSTRPILSVTNLTAASSFNDGTSYTVWANVTNTGGANSTAVGVTVRFYLTNTAGGSPTSGLAGSPGTVQFFNYTSNTTTSASPYATGVANIAYNKTVRAVITWNPHQMGNYWLWVNATAANEFAGDYKSGANAAHVTVTLNGNPLYTTLTYVGIGVGAVVVILLLILYFRRRSSRPAAKTGGKGLERGRKDEDDDEDEDDK